MRHVVIAIVVLVTAGCSESAAPRDPLSVEPSSLELFVGDTTRLHANGSAQPEYRSAAPNTATISSRGLVTGVSAGSTTVWAIRGRDSVSAAVAVRARACIAMVIVSPANATLGVGERVDVEARTTTCGTSNDFVWTSANSSIASVALRTNEPKRSMATVTGVGEGAVIVRGSLVSDPSVTVSMAVVVRKP
jgi:uncharacterized protein YjdB